METPLHVLVYQEDGEWIAHLLEMDLVGSGDTADDAEKALQIAFDAQITFCLQHEVNPFRPAPDKYFKQWNRLQKKLSRSIFDSTPLPSGKRAGYMNFTENDRRRYKRRIGYATV